MVRILLVTDDADLSNMLMVYLHHQGYEITHVTDYKSGLDIVRDTSLQMVLFGVIPNSNMSSAEFAWMIGRLNWKIGMIAFDEWNEAYPRGIACVPIPFDIEEVRLRIKNELTYPNWRFGGVCC